jgi:hypothetical protein
MREFNDMRHFSLRNRLREDPSQIVRVLIFTDTEINDMRHFSLRNRLREDPSQIVRVLIFTDAGIQRYAPFLFT